MQSTKTTIIRQRSRRACEPCRTRKVKCNGEYPCDVCKGYGYTCSFSDNSPQPKKKARIEEAAKTSPPAPDNTQVQDGQWSSIRYCGANDGNWSYLVDGPNSKDFKLSSAPFPESLISRYTTVHSAVAFPRELGRSLEMPSAPRLHSFAWNTGTREERIPNFGDRVFNQLTLQETLHRAKTFFEIIHPVFGLLDRGHFTRICIAAWSLRQMPIDLEATVCCVVALGSLFSQGEQWPMEDAIADQASLLLNISVSSPPSQLSMKFVVAWVLRALYLRCTTRAHLSWMATCNAMHIAESIGLHQEFGSMDVLRERPREVALRETCHRRKAFWVAASLNRFFSVEYGRSPVVLRSGSSCSPMGNGEEGDFTKAFVDLWQLTPKYAQHDKEEFGLALRKLVDFDVDLPPFGLLKADLCFMIFRKMRFLHMPLSNAQQELVLTLVKIGLTEATVLSSVQSKWWNVVSIPFHSVAVLIAMNTKASLELLTEAVEALRTVSSAYDTHLAQEALKTAEDLLRGFQSNKLGEADAVGHILKSLDSGRINDGQIEPDFVFSPGFDWPSEDDGSWMEVFLRMDTDQYNV